MLWFAYRLCVVVLVCLAETKEQTPSAKKASSNYSHTHIRVIYTYIYVCYGLLTVCAWWYSYAWQKRSSDSFCEESVEELFTHI